ncbi:MAG TPA: thiolase family protein, partial [Myxococcota bacterium]|nr:thiolase family protein [Myxococcota bacterium]
QGGAGQAPARQAALGAGILPKTPCTTVNKVCGSGMKAVMMAAQSIKLKESKIVVAGGMESMSNAPYLLPKARQGLRMGDGQVIDLMLKDGLFDPYGDAHMGNFGELCARELGFSREAQDQYAHQSYEKALRAEKEGWVKEEIVPVSIKVRGEEKTTSVDEEPSRYMPEKFGKLKPAFDPHGSITAANSSKISDGAAALVVADLAHIKALGLAPKARVVASATFAKDPQWFTTAPVDAIKLVLKNASLAVKDIGCFEINEAFSVVAMNAIKELSLDPSTVNMFGGAIALGHPIGCSGARVLVTLLNVMRLKKIRFGCASLCLGGGEAVAMILENMLEA